ncbi:RAMP superfamily CRISPR-associated protein [Caldithrix abyssi]
MPQLYEITLEKINYQSEKPIPFLKWNFVNTGKINLFKNRIKDLKQYQVSLTGDTKSKINIQELTGLIENTNLDDTVSALIPYSFILQTRIQLTAPYFSSDDDDFYLIQNPCLKETVFKVPMVRGSGWKGTIATAFRELINDNTTSISKSEKIQSYLRLFGTGSQEFRKLEQMIKDHLEKSKQLDFSAIINFALFELGLKLDARDIEMLKNESSMQEWIEARLGAKLEKAYWQSHKGRLIIYPTYFDRLSLEIINPHSRKTRVGTNPIHYEVVPAGTTGTLQMVYIPFDGVLMNNSELWQQIEADLQLLTQALEKATNIGIGAKAKLGWGRFELVQKTIQCNATDVKIPEEWKHE